MYQIICTIYTRKFIGDKETAEKFFEILEKNKFELKKIVLYEPIKEEYSFEKAVNMWTFTKDNKTTDSSHNNYGGMLGRMSIPQFIFGVDWWNYDIKKRLSYVDFYISVSSFKKVKKEIEQVFRELILVLDGIYGYITHDIAEARQHVTGALETRLPGVFWCNYFGKLYVDFFTEEKVLSYNWLSTEKLSNGGIITYLSDEPYGEILLNENLENSAKEHLGSDSFGDVKEEKDDIFYTQIKNVPKIE